MGLKTSSYAPQVAGDGRARVVRWHSRGQKHIGQLLYNFRCFSLGNFLFFELERADLVVRGAYYGNLTMIYIFDFKKFIFEFMSCLNERREKKVDNCLRKLINSSIPDPDFRV